jgi:hypothetical protein
MTWAISSSAGSGMHVWGAARFSFLALSFPHHCSHPRVGKVGGMIELVGSSGGLPPPLPPRGRAARLREEEQNM